MQLLNKDNFDFNKSSDDYSPGVLALYLTHCPQEEMTAVSHTAYISTMSPQYGQFESW